MRARVESPYEGIAVPYKPVRSREVASTRSYVYWYQFSSAELDTFLRSVYFSYYGYQYAVTFRSDEYQGLAYITLYYRGTTIMLTLSHSRLYHSSEYRYQYCQTLDNSFGFYPSSIEFWEFDGSSRFYTCSNVRTILNEIINGVAK